ncbi:RACGAP1 isoform 12 [Pongo abelii]|uniref:RACGAP1 isoform 12 n=1 Tax=Pongo abelii TaxID=9601 RepID=A0A2J8SY90_PONAB|nr:RACGAP1 isoform 12 [Pongo abelii]
MDTMMLNMRNLFEQLVRRAEILSEGNELRLGLFFGEDFQTEEEGKEALY